MLIKRLFNKIRKRWISAEVDVYFCCTFCGKTYDVILEHEKCENCGSKSFVFGEFKKSEGRKF